MSFTWPLALLSLLVVPLLLAAYLWQRRRRRRAAVQFSSVALIRAAMPKSSSWRRHVPFALFSLALCSMGVASARPQASVKIPIARTSIILALDVSRSMCATDVAPNRLTVAQEAARAFVRSQPKGTRIGIVAFAGFAEVVVAPTTSKDDLISAIDGLTTARGTVIGAAILKSIDAISAVNPSVRPIGVDDPGAGTGASADTVPPDTVPADSGPSDSSGSTKASPPPGGYVPDIVVVLTDGANTRGIEPVEAAKEAVSRKVRVYTIGFGTTNPTDMVCTSAQLGGAGFDSGIGGGFGGGGFGGGGFGGGGGGRRFLVIDEPTLQKVADLTGGNFYKAEDADQLKGVFAKLPKDVQLQKRKAELTAGFTALGALLAALAMFLSLRWNRTP